MTTVSVRNFAAQAVLAISLLAVWEGTGCFGPAAHGSFDKALTVGGHTQLELRNGSGHVTIRAGNDGQVRVHGDFTIWGMGYDSARHEADDLAAHPPVEQSANTVRIGFDMDRYVRASIEYIIYVPADTDARVTVGSGAIDLNDIKGPAELQSGSGRIRAAGIGDRVRATTGSGGIELERITGEATLTAGSGSISFARGSGGVTAQTGSGHVTIDHSGGRTNVRAGSGSIEIDGASADTRVTTGSGRVRINGNPASGAYWDLDTRSGSVTLELPSDASFRLNAHTLSGRIHTDFPITMEEENSRRTLRGRVGDGSARVEVSTGSGSITIH
jgi:Putative adhesin